MSFIQSPQSQTIREWLPAERPRERLASQGVSSLSDAELLAILLRTGVRGCDVLGLSREILAKFKGWRGIAGASLHDLAKMKGLGPAKSAILMAVMEIGKRQLREEVIGKNIIKDPDSVIQYLYACLRDKKREVFKVLFLSKSNQVLDEKDLFQGTVDQAAVHPREVVREAIEHHAASVILVHNHPSGRVQPSAEDREITRKIQSACEAVSIKVLDHIIVGDNQYFSFSEYKLL